MFTDDGQFPAVVVRNEIDQADINMIRFFEDQLKGERGKSDCTRHRVHLSMTEHAHSHRPHTHTHTLTRLWPHPPQPHANPPTPD